MARVLLDTDILSEILKGKNTAVAAKASAYLAASAGGRASVHCFAVVRVPALWDEKRPLGR